MIEQNTGNEQECDERDGWCVIGTKDKLRDIMSAMIRKVIRAQKPGKEDVQLRDCPLHDHTLTIH